MDITVRPYLTAGVALVGASAIAIAPAITPTPTPWTAAAPTVSSQAVDLSAAVNPIEAWIEVLALAGENLVGIGGAWWEDPFPILAQSLKNVLGYGATTIEAITGAIDSTINYFSLDNEWSFWARLANAAEALFQGNISGAVNEVVTAVLLQPVVEIGLPIFGSGLLDIPGKIAQNVANATKAFLSLDVLLPLTLGVVGPIANPLFAIGDSLQETWDALTAGQLVDALHALINIPAAVVGAVLNGYVNSDGTALPGLFTFSENAFEGGLIQALFITVPRAIAAAIAPEGEAESARAYASVAGPSDVSIGSGDLITVTEVSNGEPDGPAAIVADTTEDTVEDAPEDTVEDTAEDTVEDATEDVVDETTDVVEDVEDDEALDEDDTDSVEDDTDGSDSADDAASDDAASDDDADSGDASDSGSSADSGSDSDSGSSGGDE